MSSQRSIVLRLAQRCWKGNSMIYLDIIDTMTEEQVQTLLRCIKRTQQRRKWRVVRYIVFVLRRKVAGLFR